MIPLLDSSKCKPQTMMQKIIINIQFFRKFVINPPNDYSEKTDNKNAMQ